MESMNPQTNEKVLMTFVEAAQYLHIAGRTLQRMGIPCTKMGKLILYRKRDLDNLQEFLEFKPLKEWKKDEEESDE